MATVDCLRVRLPAVVTVNDVETHLCWQPGMNGITIDLRGWKRDTSLAAVRAVGALTELRRRGVRIEVVTGDRGLPENSKYRRLLVDNPLGFTLVRLSDDVLDANAQSIRGELLDLHRSRLESEDGLLGSGSIILAPIVDAFPWPKRASLVEQRHLPGFKRDFDELLHGRMGLPRLMGDTFPNISDFTFETLENTADHGRTGLDGTSITALRMLLVRRTNLLSTPKEIWDEIGGGPLAAFIKDLYAREPESFLKQQSIVEISVVDSGIGVPARLSRSYDIYEGAANVEADTVKKAVRSGTTSKPASLLNAGTGLWKVMRACYELSGVVVVRTGRVLLGREYTGSLRRWPDPDLLPADLELPRTGGTAWTILVPWWERGLF